MEPKYQNMVYAIVFIAFTLTNAIGNEPASSSDTENKIVTEMAPKEGQSVYQQLLAVSNLPSAEIGDTLSEVKNKILGQGGKIIELTNQQLTAHGVLEDGTEIKFDAIYFFADNRFTGHPEDISVIRTAPNFPHRFFNQLNALCGTTFQGYSTFPDDPEHDFYGKLLVAEIASCSDEKIRIPFTVGEDTSRTWIITKNADNLTLKHDHRHSDGTPDEVTNYGGTTTTLGSEYSQAFPADVFTAELIPAAATNVWTITLSKDGQSLIYFLTRNGQPRFKAQLQKKTLQ